MQITYQEHLKYNWRVHDLLQDFRIEDVWQLPVEMKSEHSLAMLQEQFSKASKELKLRGLAGMLFKIRLFVGGLLGWDKKQQEVALVPDSIRARYAQAEALSFEQLPAPGNGDFKPVYNLEQESLAEIENATVKAAIHLGRVPLKEDLFTVQMTIYVIPKGVFGKLYMMVIKPFRLWIVYPTLLKMIENLWNDYLRSE